MGAAGERMESGMSNVADDFNAIRKAFSGLGLSGVDTDDVDISADDLAEGQTCPRYQCEGRLNVGHDEEIGCSCHINPPCGACCPGVLKCSSCKEVFRYGR